MATSINNSTSLRENLDEIRVNKENVPMSVRRFRDKYPIFSSSCGIYRSRFGRIPK